MRYTDKLKVKFEPETQKVKLSIRVTDDKVESYLIDVADFRKMVGDFVILDETY